MKTPPEEHPRLPLSRRLLFSAILVIALTALLELVLTLTIGETTIFYRPSQGGILKPFIPGSEADLITPEFHVRYRINEHGFRDQPRSLEKPAGRTRVLLLGDSFSEGWGVDQGKFYSALADKALPNIEIWNTAKAGGSPLWYVYQAPHFAKSFKADAILLQLFDNDPRDISVYNKRFAFDPEGQLIGLKKHKPRPNAFEIFLKRRQLLRMGRRLRRLLSGRERMHSSPFFRPGVRAKSVLSPAQISERYPESPGAFEQRQHTEPFVKLFLKDRPEHFNESLVLEGQLLQQLGRWAKGQNIPVIVLHIADHGLFYRHLTVQDRSLHNPHFQAIAKVAKQMGWPVLESQVELSRISKTPEDFYFLHDGHWNEAGHQAIASWLSERLPELLAKAKK